MNWFIGVLLFVIIRPLIKWIIEFLYNNCFKSKINYNEIWNDYYVDVKKYYAIKYKTVPNIMYIGNIDSTAAYSYLLDANTDDIVAIKQHSYYDAQRECTLFNNTIIELKHKQMIDIGSNYVFLYYNKNGFVWANNMIVGMKKFIVTEETIKKDIVKVVGFAKDAVMN